MVPSAHDDLGKRSQFTSAFLLNHTGETPGVYQVKDDQSLFVRLDSATIADLVQQVEDVIDRSEWDLPEFTGLAETGTTGLLRELAWAGSSLYQSVIKRIDPEFAEETAPIDGEAQKIQVVCANVSSRMPFEFIYDFPAPDDTAPVCPKASEALLKGSCDLCKERNENPAKVICPLGFWCMSRVIEWHAFTEELAESTQNAPFLLQTTGLAAPSWLMVMKDPLVGYSSKVTSAQPNSIQDLQASFSKAGAPSPTIVTSWDKWKENIVRLQPSLEILLVHTEKKGARTMIEIGEEMLSTLNLEGYITDKKSWPAIVLLLGCGTGTSRVQFQSVAAMVEACHAAIIVSTTSDVFGPIASKLASYFVEQLGALKKPQSFGDIMLTIRRKALAEGISMILCLRTYGDADWQLIKS
jgi:cytochrome c553